MSNDSRIETLRRRCLDRKNKSWVRTPVIDAVSLRRSEDKPWPIRCGLRTRDRLAAARFHIDDLELLVGRITPPAASEDQVEEAKAYLGQFSPAPGQTAHCEVDVDRLFSLGIDGLIGLINERLESHQADTERRDTLHSFKDAFVGMAAFVENAAGAVENALAAADSDRRSELDNLLKSCRRIAHRPPETFRDAIQLLWLVEMACMYGENIGYVVPGRLDQRLLPYYLRDSRDGTLDDEEALRLVESLYLLINEFVPDGGAVSAMVGGRGPNGGDVTNPLSYLCLEALRRTNLVYPTVGVCWHEDTPDELTDLAVELIASGYVTPAFFNDKTIQKGLMSYGLPPEEACLYINSTCVEITPVGTSNVWVASPYFSTCQFLLDEIADQVENGGQAPDFETFLDRYQKRLGREIAKGAERQNQYREARLKFGGKPLQGALTKDCLEECLDIDRGGARYNWVECSFVGLANLADSLMVLRCEVYELKNMTLKEMKTTLDADFNGFEERRRRFLDAHPKYGNNDPEVDGLVGRIAKFAQNECSKHRMEPDGSPFVPGAFCWVMHERLGAACGATPDGRGSGAPFADGGGPAQGREKQGPTSAILSTTSWDHSPLIGGLAYNMKFDKRLFETNADGGRRLRDLIVTFLRRGGFETQINVVDREVLRKARECPDEYSDLVVRIGGYTGYFTRLSPGMQEEVMNRTEFSQL